MSAAEPSAFAQVVEVQARVPEILGSVAMEPILYARAPGAFIEDALRAVSRARALLEQAQHALVLEAANTRSLTRREMGVATGIATSTIQRWVNEASR
ncbi:hypothetical protein LG293_16690 (plasmid) [Citricoccus nitrophenolicus]